MDKRKLQVKFCRICIHRKIDLEKGLICKQTNDLADFDEICQKFEEDIKEKERVLNQDLSVAGNDNARNSIDPKKNKEIGGLIFLVGVLIAIFSITASSSAGFFIIPIGLITYGAYTYYKGIEQVKILEEQQQLDKRVEGEE